MSSKIRASFVTFVIVLSIACVCQTYTVDRNEADEKQKREVFESLTETEKRLIFGDESKPQFEIVLPIWSQKWNTASEDRSTEIRELTIMKNGKLINFELKPSQHFMDFQAEAGLDGDFIHVPNTEKVCHWRFVNATYVVTVDQCLKNGIHAMIISKNYHEVLYPANIQRSPGAETAHHPHILYQLSRSILESVVSRNRISLSNEKNQAGFTRRKRDDSDGTGKLTEYVDVIDEFQNFPEIRVDLESDLDRFRVRGGHSHYVITAKDFAEQLPVDQIRLRKTVEIAVFCDSALTQNFGQNLQGTSQITLQQYIAIMFNAVEGIYHQEELGGYIIDLKIVHIRYLNPGEGPNTFGGDIGSYLTEFSTWQSTQNPGTDTNPNHWDHAIMLSGLNLHSGGNTGVIGLAWVGGMCSSQHSATMNEGGSFLSVYIIAHEMGHNLGMDHDGSNSFASCNSNNHIMSPSVGPGKTTWSSCSVQVIQQFLTRSTCLDDSSSTVSTSTAWPPTTTTPPTYTWPPTTTTPPTYTWPPTTTMPPTTTNYPGQPDIEEIKRNLPGQVFPPDKQCQLAYGADYSPAVGSGNDICSYLFCTGRGSTRGAHPALQGSVCGNGQICIAGSCKDEGELLRLIVLFIDVFRKVSDDREVIGFGESDGISHSDGEASKRKSLENQDEEARLHDQQSVHFDSKSENNGEDHFSESKFEMRSISGPCSVTCGLGQRTVQFDCVSRVDGTKVPVAECQMNGATVPFSVSERCQMPYCSQSSWITSQWSKCSNSCGQGVRYRRVFCGVPENEILGSSFSEVDASECLQTMPHSKEQCYGSCIF